MFVKVYLRFMIFDPFHIRVDLAVSIYQNISPQLYTIHYSSYHNVTNVKKQKEKKKHHNKDNLTASMRLYY